MVNHVNLMRVRIETNKAMMFNDALTSRAQVYRAAGRSLRYRVYVVMELVWNGLAIYAVARDLLRTPGNTAVAALVLLVVIAFAHSLKMTLREPWQVLKAALFGAFVLAVGLVLKRISGIPSDPAVPAVVAGSAYYLWLGELWTRRIAAIQQA